MQAAPATRVAITDLPANIVLSSRWLEIIYLPDNPHGSKHGTVEQNKPRRNGTGHKPQRNETGHGGTKPQWIERGHGGLKQATEDRNKTRRIETNRGGSKRDAHRRDSPQRTRRITVGATTATRQPKVERHNPTATEANWNETTLGEATKTPAERNKPVLLATRAKVEPRTLNERGQMERMKQICANEQPHTAATTNNQNSFWFWRRTTHLCPLLVNSRATLSVGGANNHANLSAMVKSMLSRSFWQTAKHLSVAGYNASLAPLLRDHATLSALVKKHR